MSRLIMTVDDSASMRQAVGQTLRKGGYSVVEAHDGALALALLEQTCVHLLITDLNMPGMSGLELVRKVRALPQYRFLPILLLTTESEHSKKEEARLAGASGWIVKPFAPDQLLKVLQRLLPNTQP